MNKLTIKEFRMQFPDDDACLDSVFLSKHPEGSRCPKCNSTGTYSRVKCRQSYQCGKCSNQIYPCKGTIFQKSRTPLLVWFEIIFLFIKSKNGISAKEVQRITGVTYKTAYRMLLHIRKCMVQGNDRLFGTFQLDETFVGGVNKNRHHDKKYEHAQGRSFKDKTPVFGMYHQETGKVRAMVIEDTSRFSIQPLIYSNIKKDSTVFTDEWLAYNGIGEVYEHSSVDHRSKQYVSGNTTTNAIENFWSHLKRTLKGSYISVSRRRLQMYVNEVVFRFNERENDAIYETLLAASFVTPSSPLRRTRP